MSEREKALEEALRAQLAPEEHAGDCDDCGYERHLAQCLDAGCEEWERLNHRAHDLQLAALALPTREPEPVAEPTYRAVRAILHECAEKWREVQRANSKNTNGAPGASYMPWEVYVDRLHDIFAPSPPAEAEGEWPVAALRERATLYRNAFTRRLFLEAADEIERLRAALRKLSDAALKYDALIRTAADQQKSWVEGESLDDAYSRWQEAAVEARDLLAVRLGPHTEPEASDAE